MYGSIYQCRPEKRFRIFWVCSSSKPRPQGQVVTTSLTHTSWMRMLRSGRLCSNAASWITQIKKQLFLIVVLNSVLCKMHIFYKIKKSIFRQTLACVCTEAVHILQAPHGWYTKAIMSMVLFYNKIHFWLVSRIPQCCHIRLSSNIKDGSLGFSPSAAAPVTRPREAGQRVCNR